MTRIFKIDNVSRSPVDCQVAKSGEIDRDIPRISAPTSLDLLQQSPDRIDSVKGWVEGCLFHCDLCVAIIDTKSVPSPHSLLEDELPSGLTPWGKASLERLRSNVLAFSVSKDVELYLFALVPVRCDVGVSPLERHTHLLVQTRLNIKSPDHPSKTKDQSLLGQRLSATLSLAPTKRITAPSIRIRILQSIQKSFRSEVIWVWEVPCVSMNSPHIARDIGAGWKMVALILKDLRVCMRNTSEYCDSPPPQDFFDDCRDVR